MRDPKEFINKILSWYAERGITPGEGWAFPDDKSSLCFEDSHRVTGHALWIDLEDDGTIRVLFRPDDGAESEAMTFTHPSS